MDIDVSETLNSATLGPYSFQAFVSTTWSKEKVTNMPKGRRASIKSGPVAFKRPLAKDVKESKGGGNKRGWSSMMNDSHGNDNFHAEELNVRRLRSRAIIK